MSPIPAHLEAILLTTDDLARNEQGQLGVDQRQTLYRQRLAWIIGTAAFLLIAGALLAALIGALLAPGVVELEALAVLFPLGVCWLWLLRRALPQWQRINHDLAEGQVAAIEGRVQCDFTHSFGLLHFLKYRVHIGDHSFQVDKQAFLQFKHSALYRVFYTPHAKVLLGALSLPDRPPMLRQEIQPPRPDEELVRKSEQPILDLAAPLNAQEIAILRLIAAGRSNKEIADELALSVNTIKMYSSQIYRKLGVRRRTEAVAYARTKGFL